MDLIKDVVDEEIKKHKLYRPQAVKMKTSTERSSKVKVWTDEEIRDRDGLVSRPFKTLNENIVWAVKTLGQCTLKQVYEYLDAHVGTPLRPVNKASVGATMSQLKLLPYTEVGATPEGKRTIKLPHMPLDTIINDLYQALNVKRAGYRRRGELKAAAEGVVQSPPSPSEVDEVTPTEDQQKELSKFAASIGSICAAAKILSTMLEKLDAEITITFKKR